MRKTLCKWERSLDFARDDKLVVKIPAVVQNGGASVLASYPGEQWLELRGDRAFVAFDQAVPQMNGATRMNCDIAFVGNKNDRVAALIEVFQQRHDFFAGFGVEVTGGFV